MSSLHGFAQSHDKRLPRGSARSKLLSRLIGRIRRHWPNTHITIRGDGHYGREEVMTWCENYGIDYIFGLSGNVVLDRLVEAAADDIRVRRAVNQAEVLRGFAEKRYAAKSWDKSGGSWPASRPAPATTASCRLVAAGGRGDYEIVGARSLGL
jgi:Transposase DDE domain group 1